MSQPTVYERNPRLTEPAARQAWQESFQPVLADLRAQLRGRPPQEIAGLAGATWDESAAAFRLHWLDRAYRITWPDLTAYAHETSEPAPASTQGLFLYYLARADGTPRAGRWIGFRELPDGWLYHQAFQGYTGNRLAQALGNDPAAYARQAESLGGRAIDLGDCSYAFQVLPAIWLAVVYWRGDEEFPAQAQVLFDGAAERYLPQDGLALLGSQLVGRLLAQERS